MRICLAVAVVTMGASPALALTTTYDAFSSFSATPGMTGPFTYGSFDVPTGVFTGFAPGGMCNTPNVICQSASPVPEILPEVLKSLVGAFNYSTAHVPDDALDFHPGLNPDQSNSVAIMFTAPRAGVYTINGTAAVSDIAPSGTNLYGYSSPSGGSTMWLGTLSSAALSYAATTVLTLARGETIGLIVGNDGDYRYDTTAINFSATVAGVPETGAWAMMVAGFGLIGVTARRRQRVLAA